MTNSFFPHFQLPSQPDASTIDDLYQRCPVRFKRLDSPWNSFASKIRRAGGVPSWASWKFRLQNEREREYQVASLLLLTAASKLHSPSDPERDRRYDAVAGWMLSEMLVAMPEDPTRNH